MSYKFESLAIHNHDVEYLIDVMQKLLGKKNQLTHPTPTRTDTPEWRFKCIMRLQGHAEDLMPRKYQVFFIIMRLVAISSRFQNDEQQRFLQLLLAHFLMILPVNCFKTELIHGSGITKCTVFDILSVFNHSCSTNLVSIFSGRTMYLISNRKIKKKWWTMHQLYRIWNWKYRTTAYIFRRTVEFHMQTLKRQKVVDIKILIEVLKILKIIWRRSVITIGVQPLAHFLLHIVKNVIIALINHPERKKNYCSD